MASQQTILCLAGSGTKTTQTLIAAKQKALSQNKHWITCDTSEMNSEDVYGVIAQKGLFDTQQRVIELVYESYSKDIHTQAQAIIKTIPEGDTAVVRIRESLTKPRQTMITKSGWQLVYSEPEKKEELKPFAFTTACIAKNKKEAWLQLCTLLEQGSAPQALIGALTWQFKTLYMVMLEVEHDEQFKTIKPFTRTSTKKHSNKWNKQSVQSQYESLLELQNNFGLSAEKLEKWVLEIV